MCLVKIVFAVFVYTVVRNEIFVSSQEGEGDVTTEPLEDQTEPPPLENHSFVALIDILFVDGSKRTCTGTIIHDHAVITAAHCFLNHDPDSVDVEISGSFVVIGTKKMFDTGYENYLPIERIITHPRYKGWTADLALVFTFAGMTTDKPGNIIPLIGENAPTPVDSNVTILSWGSCADLKETATGSGWPNEKKRRCTSSEEDHDSCEIPRTRKPLRTGSASSEQEPDNDPGSSQLHRAFQGDKKETEHGLTGPSARATTVGYSNEVMKALNVLKLTVNHGELQEPEEFKEPSNPIDPLEPKQINASVKTSGQPNQTISRRNEKLTKTLRRHRNDHQKAHGNDSITNVKEGTQADAIQHPKNQTKFSEISIQSYNKNRRRQVKPPLTTKEHKLTVELFGFVNVQTCKKLIDKALPSMYGIIPNEVVCYAAEEHYISDDDSGAPAIRKGHLVAVTVGGVEGEGDHVALGMRMDCFCSWIAENLPAGDTIMHCCTDCCGDHTDHTYKRYKRFNKEIDNFHSKT